MNHPGTSSGHANPVNPIDPPHNHSIVQIPQQLPPAPQQPNSPPLDLLQGPRTEYAKVGVPLYEAAIKGDWNAAKLILDENLDLVRYAITENHETLLHVAASTERTKAVKEFVINLVTMMKKEDLELQNKNLNTALTLAAQAGNIETAKILVEKNPALIEISNISGVTPLYMAALFSKPDMVNYLYGVSKKMNGDCWTPNNRGWVLQKCVEADIFDVAIQIVIDRPELCDNKQLLTHVLLALAQKTKAFERKKLNVFLSGIKSISALFHVNLWPREKDGELALQLLKLICEKLSKMSKTDIDDIIRGPSIWVEKEYESDTKNKIKTYPFRVLFHATKMGNTRFIIELIRIYPDVTWKVDDKGKTIFHLAIKRRQEKIYSLLHEIGAMKDLIIRIKDKKGNYMLHMVAKSAKHIRFQSVSGVALQMQRELLWFKEVENTITLQYSHKKNADGETPRDWFTKKHVDLVTKGEIWMKDTASQCMVVATLIATIAFAAAFTLPGGYNQNTGIPFFRTEPAFIIFVISDAVSLISSSTSVLIFLSILTSRYAEHDFLTSLPNKLLTGLATLFLSILTMMVAFSASFFVLYNKQLQWVPITITGLAGMPVIIFAILQFRLLRDVFVSTYRSKYLFKPKKRVLYY
ncbi:putative ankyrin repeat-containing domain, PGG domain, ankyrin repeat-containing domain superfamily [Helianthus annuus]|uniref:protein ACCELERATED CELL DEATH 6 n=1 Tax=Helianthus annuus TaxID=4232 RepID=UPI000B8FCC11|nr:protein ACCELERATED CELL DEATH 6 [Helianthus annuus]KAJ0437998.1 putative ankyrin repeat-containing domain, PGG domain, ankyrin repeat-containing domain superfamily [Helianthus annuus]KAJ0460327.1 putative ankyrin repeat-containing domain, PGG domain, ankyrin repeat-containing domain superfamily [Helianthus annuus]